MTNDNFKLALPYIGLPVISITFLVIYLGSINPFFMLLHQLIIVFGYIAAVSDIKTKKIPNTLVLAMLGVWVIVMVPQLFSNVSVTVDLLIESLLGFLVGGGLFLLVYVVSRKGLGGGDVKFMAAAGLYLGFAGVVPTMLYGTVLAGIVGLALLLMKKIGKKDAIPLAPFLYVGMLITLFFG